MKTEFKPCTVYTYPYHAVAANGRKYIVISAGMAWDYEFNILVTSFDESSNVSRQSGVLTLKFP